MRYTGQLAIDFCTNRICWTHRVGNIIECSNYTGGEIRQVHNTTGKLNGIAIQDGVAYLPTVNPNRVLSLPLTGGNPTILDTGTFNTSGFVGIAILHRGHHCIGNGSLLVV
ncbi:hypothetical protein NP493_610g00005 [Ridgeia piscesae]|uniref:Uncharacterized protein n=1 Tax=Ridgeia piscesae TaxID=27915 RepID=A0AAD9NP63_RIDPI|nr:hypothetical protein NP493_610g00005 [Ridgeia piscesae]